MLGVADCIIRRVIPEPPKRENIGNQINAAMILAGADFVNVFNLAHDFLSAGNEKPPCRGSQARNQGLGLAASRRFAFKNRGTLYKSSKSWVTSRSRVSLNSANLMRWLTPSSKASLSEASDGRVNKMKLISDSASRIGSLT